MRYEARHAYAATRDGRRFGPWAPGEIVDLEPDDAEWIERDSPGALTDAATTPNRQKHSTPNRQNPPGANRSG